VSNGDTQEASCLQEVTEQALRESEALRAISEDLLAPTELKAVLSAVLDRVTQLFTPDRAGIALRNLAANQPEQRAWESFEARPKEGGQSSWSLWRGFSKELLAGLGRQPMLPQELPRWLTLRHAIVYEDLQAASTLPEIIRAPLLKEGLLALLAIPLVHSRGLSGFLVLGYDQTHHFREREIIFAEAIGRQIAVVAENARLYEQTRELAAAEERARLARELHDSVSQSLFSLTLAVQTARDHLIAHPALAEQALALADDLARGALAEMRTLLFELRSTALQDEGLAAALEKHAAVVQHRAGLEVQVQVEDQRRLPADQEEALYRIAQ
jgi:signal transduction histidine kinase